MKYFKIFPMTFLLRFLPPSCSHSRIVVSRWLALTTYFPLASTTVNVWRQRLGQHTNLLNIEIVYHIEVSMVCAFYTEDVHDFTPLELQKKGEQINIRR